MSRLIKASEMHSVFIPIDLATSIPALVVKAYADGRVVCLDEYGEIWHGWEYQIQEQDTG